MDLRDIYARAVENRRALNAIPRAASVLPAVPKPLRGLKRSVRRRARRKRDTFELLHEEVLHLREKRQDGHGVHAQGHAGLDHLRRRDEV